MTTSQVAREIVKNAKIGVNSAVELGQVTGNKNIIDLLMVAIISGIEEKLTQAISEEREACAKVAKDYVHHETISWTKGVQIQTSHSKEFGIATAIRKRGEVGE